MTKGNLSACAFLLLIVVAALLVCPAHATASDACRRPLSIGELVRRAPRLDGQVVCMRGVLVHWPVDGRAQNFVVIAPEMTSLAQLTRGGRETEFVGLIGCDEKRADGAYPCKPETINRLEEADATAQARVGQRSLLDVTVRGTVMYKRRLVEQIRQLATHTLWADALQGAQRDVELILLEVVNVHGKLADTPRVRR